VSDHPPPYWASIVETDRLIDRLASRLEMLREIKRQEAELKRRAEQSDCMLLKLQA
jgi:hypothetical protein